MRVLFRLLIALLLLSIASPQISACENWECHGDSSISLDCQIRFGPDAYQFPYAVECIVKHDCMGESCMYWCEYNTYCFSI